MLSSDPYRGESIFLHEFAHTIMNLGLVFVQPSFQDSLEGAFQQATAGGLWRDTYAASNSAEYWAEGVHSFLYDADCPPDIKATSENGPTNPFSVDSTAKIQNSTVFIRRRGLYLTEIKSDAFGHLIHPSQETAAVYSLFASSLEDAKRLQAECKVLIKIDNGLFVNMTAMKIDKTQ